MKAKRIAKKTTKKATVKKVKSAAPRGAIMRGLAVSARDVGLAIERTGQKIKKQGYKKVGLKVANMGRKIEHSTDVSQAQ